MGVSDAKYAFTMVDIGAEGRASDGGVFENSLMGKKLIAGKLNIPQPEPLPDYNEPLPYVLLGEAFALSNFMLRPYPRSRQLDLKKKVFNYRLSIPRRCVESSFGIMTSVWRILRRPLNTSLETNTLIAKGIAALHNFFIKFDDHDYNAQCKEYSKKDDDLRWTDFEPNPDITVINKNKDVTMRNHFARYFMTTGAFEPQWRKALNADF